MRLALWSPGPDDGGPASLVPTLSQAATVERVGRAPETSPAADLHLYHVADDPAHAFVHRALRARPGIVILEDWNLHRLVHAESAGTGDEAGYRHEARHAHGEVGAFVARQVLGGLGGRLPSLVPMNERVMEAALGVVATSTALRDRVAARLPRRPVLHMPLAFASPPPLPEPSPVRAQWGIDEGRFVVLVLRTAFDSSPDERVAGALARLSDTDPRVAVRWAADDDPGFAQELAAADVVVALEDPVRDGLRPAVARAVAGGRPTLVSAGGGAARELPAGVVGHVPPGAHEQRALWALLRGLLRDPDRREQMSARASAFAAARRDPEPMGQALLDLVESLSPAASAEGRAFTARRSEEATLASLARAEVARGARELGVLELPEDVALLATGLFPEEAL